MRKIVRKILESGPLYTIHYAFSALMPARIAAIESAVVLGKSLSGDDLPDAEDDFTWIVSTQREILIRSGYTREQLESRFERGAFAATLMAEGRVIACSWYSPAQHSDFFWIRFVAERDAVWIWDVWVEPELRGQGLAGRLIRRAERDLKAKGYSRVINTVDKLNRNSLRAFARAGYAPLTEFLCLRFLRFTVIRSGRRWYFGRFTGRSPFEMVVPSSRDPDVGVRLGNR